MWNIWIQSKTILLFDSNLNLSNLVIQWKEEKLPLKELEECCHLHDLCYDECGADKDLCDLHFKKCLYKVCSSNEDELSLLFMKGRIFLKHLFLYHKD